MFIHHVRAQSVRHRKIQNLVFCVVLYLSFTSLSYSQGYTSSSELIGHRYESVWRVNLNNTPVVFPSAKLASDTIILQAVDTERLNLARAQEERTIIFYSLTLVSILILLSITLYYLYKRTIRRNKKLRETGEQLQQLVNQLLKDEQVNEESDNLSYDIKDIHADFIRRITDITSEEMCNQRFCSTLLAEKMCMSISQLNRKLKVATAHSSYHFICKLRIEAAKNKLINEDKAINQIAAECGFYDAAHFSRTFKKHTNVTPTQFRKLS